MKKNSKAIELDWANLTKEQIKIIAAALDDGTFEIKNGDGSELYLPLFRALVKSRNAGLATFIRSISTDLLRVFSFYETDYYNENKENEDLEIMSYNGKAYNVNADLIITTIYLTAYEQGTSTIKTSVDDLILRQTEFRAILFIEHLRRIGVVEDFVIEEDTWDRVIPTKLVLSKDLMLAMNGIRTEEWDKFDLTEYELEKCKSLYDFTMEKSKERERNERKKDKKV